MSDRIILPVQAVILDMDGLVIDSESTYVTAWRRAAMDVGAFLEDAFLEGLFGRHADDVTRMMADRLGIAFDPHRFFLAAETYWFEEIHSQGIPKMPGLDELLNALTEKGLPYALATNSDARYAEICLERSGLLTAFPVRVTRDQVVAGKPAPDLFLEAASRLGVLASDSLVLEDSATGLLAARAAGACPVLIQSRQDRREQLTPLAQQSFPSLLNFTQSLLDALATYDPSSSSRP